MQGNSIKGLVLVGKEFGGGGCRGQRGDDLADVALNRCQVVPKERLPFKAKAGVRACRLLQVPRGRGDIGPTMPSLLGSLIPGEVCKVGTEMPPQTGGQLEGRRSLGKRGSGIFGIQTRRSVEGPRT